MKIILKLLALIPLITGVAKAQEIKVVNVQMLQTFISDRLGKLKSYDKEKIIIIDITLAKEYSEENIPSIMLTNEPVDPNSVMSDDDTWYDLSVSGDNPEVITMTDKWEEELDQQALSSNFRVYSFIPESETQGFINIEKHGSIKVQF